jgi:hypothetical protein
MATSQNGWPVVGQSAVVDRAVLGVEFPNGWLKGDVDVVFTYLIGRLHREVEPLDDGGCWGWFVKKIEGSKTISNHASGTAIDYNAPAHPMGVRNTYSASDRAKIRAILADLNGVVRWGGDYTGRPDDMHFEIVKGTAAVRAVAEKIRGDLPMDQAAFNKLMDGWAKTATGAAALNGLTLDDKIGDKANKQRTVGDLFRDLAKLRGYLVGDQADTANAAIPAGAPISRVVAAAKAADQGA